MSKEQPAYYKDKGCIYAPSCLKCPFPLIGGLDNGRCLHDLTRLEQKALFSDRKLRNEVIYKSYKVGRDPEDLAKLFGLSEKTINTIIKKARLKGKE